MTNHPASVVAAKDSASVSRQVIVRWATWLTAIVVATLGMYLARAVLDKAHVTLVFLLVVLGASAAGGRALGLTVASLAFLSFDFFFLSPYSTLTITNPLDWLVLVAFLITSIVATQLLYRANATAEAATERAREVDRLAGLGAETLNAADADEALRAIAGVIRNSVDVDECDIYLRRAGGIDAVARATRSVGDTTNANEKDTTPESRQRFSRDDGLVEWIIQHGTGAVELEDGTVRLSEEFPRNRGDDPPVRAFALPLRVRDHIVGVLRIATAHTLVLTAEQARLLKALAYYAALGAERARLVATAERAEAERRVEALRGALLTAVSHDLRTPLTTIKGIANEIGRGGDPARASVIEEEADQLNALIGDLLDLSRIHSGAVRPSLAVNTIDDLLGAALRRVSGVVQGRRVDVELPPGALLVGMFDFTQALRILVNLIDNAAKYSPPGAPIEIHASQDAQRLRIDVLDRGPGVPESERERIFEPFYRPPGVPPDIRGHGLGLSIARGLAEAQGGALRFRPRPGGGSIFSLDLTASNTRDPELLSAQDVG